jgi:succinate-acetate transporter protein
MAIDDTERIMATPATVPVVADPAPLGLAAFALTTFVLSAHNAAAFGFGLPGHGNAVVIGLALFYGGLAQFMAGMWSFRNRNTFTATAFSTYGGFWLALGTYLALITFGKVPAGDILVSLGWFLLAFAIFNTYMMVWSLRTNLAVFGVFLTLEITEIVLAWGFFAGNTNIIHIGGWIGIITAIVAWYTSAADVITSMRGGRPYLPVGTPLWTETADVAPARTTTTTVRR